jgi:hypothetical protein
MKAKLSVLITLIISSLLLLPHVSVVSAGSFVNFTNPALSSDLLNLPVRGYFQGLWGAFFTIGIILGVLIFFFILIIGGIQWITSGGDRAKLEAARSRLREGLVGIVILLSFFASVYVVEFLYNINLRAFRVSPLIIGGLPLPTGPGPNPGGTNTPTPTIACVPGIYPNDGSYPEESCNQVCNQHGATCYSVGSEPSTPNDGLAHSYSAAGNLCTTISATCSTVMQYNSSVCNTRVYTTDYTFCNCTCGGATPTPPPPNCQQVAPNVIVNSATGVSCSALCQQCGLGNCSSIGSDLPGASNQSVHSYNTLFGCAYLYSGSCSDQMIQWSANCQTPYDHDWTYCNCGGGATPTPLPDPVYIYLNRATSTSSVNCNTVCQNNGHSCVNAGTDAGATNGRYSTYSNGCTELDYADITERCNRAMQWYPEGLCSPDVEWTYCGCI